MIPMRGVMDVVVSTDDDDVLCYCCCLLTLLLSFCWDRVCCGRSPIARFPTKPRDYLFWYDIYYTYVLYTIKVGTRWLCRIKSSTSSNGSGDSTLETWLVRLALEKEFGMRRGRKNSVFGSCISLRFFLTSHSLARLLFSWTLFLSKKRPRTPALS